MSRRLSSLLFLLALVTYSQHIAPILDWRCIECHTAGSTLDLSRYPFASIETDDQNSIVGLILGKAATGSPQMPPGNRPKLTAAQIRVIEQWRDQGLAP